MRLAIVALVLLACLTTANMVVYQREMRGLQNPYSGATTVTGAIVGTAIAQDASRKAARDAWLREAAAAGLTAILWLSIARSGKKSDRT